MTRATEMAMQMLPMGEGGQLLHFVTRLRPLRDLRLRDSTREILERSVAEHRDSKKLRAAGLRPANRILFVGPPGCGKTTAAGALAHAADIPLAVLRLDAVIGRYMGTSAPNLRNAFEYATKTPMVLLIDEADALGATRAHQDATGAAQEHLRIMNALLQLSEDFRDSGSILVAATNLHEALDPALWRRFDEIVMFSRPTEVEAAALVKDILARYGQNPVLWRWPTWLKDISHADAERIALDAVKAVTMGEAASIDRALRAAAERQQERRELTSAKTKRRRP